MELLFWFSHCIWLYSHLQTILWTKPHWKRDIEDDNPHLSEDSRTKTLGLIIAIHFKSALGEGLGIFRELVYHSWPDFRDSCPVWRPSSVLQDSFKFGHWFGGVLLLIFFHREGHWLEYCSDLLQQGKVGMFKAIMHTPITVQPTIILKTWFEDIYSSDLHFERIQRWFQTCSQWFKADHIICRLYMGRSQ